MNNSALFDIINDGEALDISLKKRINKIADLQDNKIINDQLYPYFSYWQFLQIVILCSALESVELTI